MQQKEKTYILKPNWNLKLGETVFPEFKFKSYSEFQDFIQRNHFIISHQYSTKKKNFFVYF